MMRIQDVTRLFFNKRVTVPMRVRGAIISVIPGVGGIADESIDTAADVIDMIPI